MGNSLQRICGAGLVAVVAVLLFAGSVRARPVGMYPATQLVERLETFLKAHPDDYQAHYQLGRVHEVAFTEAADRILDAYPADDGRCSFYSYGGVFDATRGAGDKRISDQQRKAHLLAAIAAYRRAVELQPKDVLAPEIARLRLATMLEAAAENADGWKLLHPAGPQKELSDAERKTAEALIGQLGSESYEVRAHASEALRPLALRAQALLEAHREQADAEVRTRVAGLLAHALTQPWRDEAAAIYRAIVAEVESPKPGDTPNAKLAIRHPGAKAAVEVPDSARPNFEEVLVAAGESLLRVGPQKAEDLAADPLLRQARDLTERFAQGVRKLREQQRMVPE